MIADRPSDHPGPAPLGARRSASRFDKALRLSPAQAMYRRRAATRLTVLAYHGVADPDGFAGHLDHLRRSMRPIELADLLAALAGRRKLPPRSVLITFDDGERSLVDVGLPLLVERQLPAVAFVVAGLIDTDEPYWWTEVEWHHRAGGRAPAHASASPADVVRGLKAAPDEARLAALEVMRADAPGIAPRTPQLRTAELKVLESSGVAVGNHSLTHPCLPRCTYDKVREEVFRAHALLAAALGHEPQAFAYPNGDCDERAQAAVQQAGYAAAFLFDHRASPLLPVDALRISRIRVDSTTPLDRFRILVSGLHPALHHLRGRP